MKIRYREVIDFRVVLLPCGGPRYWYLVDRFSDLLAARWWAVLVMFVLSACDPCWSTPVHVDRCEHGDEASCVWLLEHVDAATGACEVRR